MTVNVSPLPPGKAKNDVPPHGAALFARVPQLSFPMNNAVIWFTARATQRPDPAGITSGMNRPDLRPGNPS
jgi:hypothetical protein